jgi:DNA-binding XRE family transcriptional regulator
VIVGVARSWLWNVNKTEEEARKILKDPAHPAFLLYAARRLANANLPREIFRDYLSKEDFLKCWPAIKRQMNKDSRNHDRILFWGGVHEYLKRDLKRKGISVAWPKAEIRVDPDQQKTGQSIRELRRSRKMTQAELARKTGLTQQHIAKIEKGATCPRPQTLKKIRERLGLHAYPEATPAVPFYVRDATISTPGTTWIFSDFERDK